MDKVQYHKSDAAFNMWQMSGGRDWKGLLSGMLGQNLVTKMEILARNVWFKGPKDYWTYAGNAESWADLDSTTKFSLEIVNDWNLRMGSTGSPVIPGDTAGLSVATLPPGAVYDFMKSLAGASANEASMWRDAHLYAGQQLNYEIGTFKNCRFTKAPNNKFGINPNVFYNAGAITKQYGVVEPIRAGDGSPDPQTTVVDGTWHVGQKNATHYIKVETAAGAGDFVKNDFVTIHIKTTNAYGTEGGVDPFDGKTIVRRVVAYDHAANMLTFDRPIGFNYTSGFAGKSVTGNADGTFYAYVTKGVHVGFSLVLGNRGGVKGKVLQPIEFYTPKPVDDFDSVWRFSYDGIFGHNIAEPNMFELHFFTASVPKPGGVA